LHGEEGLVGSAADQTRGGARAGSVRGEAVLRRVVERREPRAAGPAAVAVGVKHELEVRRVELVSGARGVREGRAAKRRVAP
jgi:hypothetical protein